MCRRYPYLLAHLSATLTVTLHPAIPVNSSLRHHSLFSVFLVVFIVCGYKWVHNIYYITPVTVPAPSYFRCGHNLSPQQYSEARPLEIKDWETTDVVICGCGPPGAMLSAYLGQMSIPNVVL
ncbi:hypothetical protein BDV38DRAFT_94094 [Aspergillus pseudotamarii]|uniref:FAD-binding domain-containing protein n=1 Tax=Aspergillus pseudotamarii TaxID=132259 RepID=A0A5N6T974_ASPPS|nr:uncharacterized protein BDV38DRAFT_94094 [Aspergillus pseudotamarii]KAE8142836.1 hypothetical protein BDV38DRAFT_94094 [Aspergillus pseudotamarii]